MKEAMFRSKFCEFPLCNKRLFQIENVLNAVIHEEVTEEVTGEVLRLLSLCREPKSRKELMELLVLRHEEHFRIAYLLPALGLDLLQLTIPDKPTSRLQKYRLTSRGDAQLAKGKKG